MAASNKTQVWFSVTITSLWSPYGIGQTIIFLTCGYFFLSSFFISSPNLSRRRLDFCHTSRHGVALVWISDAGLKPAARGSLKTQDAKKSPTRMLAINVSNPNLTVARLQQFPLPQMTDSKPSFTRKPHVVIFRQSPFAVNAIGCHGNVP